jgi:predicted nucleic acid-binding protein
LISPWTKRSGSRGSKYVQRIILHWRIRRCRLPGLRHRQNAKTGRARTCFSLTRRSISIGFAAEWIPLIEPFIKARTLAICGVIRAEVIRGIIHPAQKAKINTLLDLMEDFAIDSAMWRDIAELAWRLDRKGYMLPLTDVAISFCSLRLGATLITLDEHFSKVPDLHIARTLPRLR